MAEIVPAVLAETASEFKHDMELAVSLNDRIQIDLADGKFASNTTVSLAQVYWPQGTRADLHMMYEDPKLHTSSIIAIKPHLAIIHSEAKETTQEESVAMLRELSGYGIKTGLALLPRTGTETVAPYLEFIDHVMVFSGELGYYGGEFDRSALDKIAKIKSVNSGIEVGVDGGIDDTNAADIVAAGADVLNVGSFLQQSSDPQAAYAKLKASV